MRRVHPQAHFGLIVWKLHLVLVNEEEPSNVCLSLFLRCEHSNSCPVRQGARDERNGLTEAPVVVPRAWRITLQKPQRKFVSISSAMIRLGLPNMLSINDARVFPPGALNCRKGLSSTRPIASRWLAGSPNPRPGWPERVPALPLCCVCLARARLLGCAGAIRAQPGTDRRGAHAVEPQPILREKRIPQYLRVGQPGICVESSS